MCGLVGYVNNKTFENEINYKLVTIYFIGSR